MWLQSLYNFVADYYNYYSNRFYESDTYKIATQKDQFIFDEVLQRCLDSEKGYAVTALSGVMFNIYNFMVVTGKDYVLDAVVYGEYFEKSPDKFDPKARSVFDLITNIIGVKVIANDIGPGANFEHSQIKKYSSPKQGIQHSIDIYKNLIANWSENISINDMVCNASVNLIAKSWFNIDNIPLQVSQTLEQIEDCLVNQDSMSKEQIKQLKDKTKQFNDSILAENEDKINNTDNYLRDLLERGKYSGVTESNALYGLMVEGNITTLISCALIHFASNKPHLDRLKQELEQIKGDITAETYEKEIRGLKFFHNIFLESLRFFAPALPVVRYASKPGKVGDLDVPARTFIFVSLKSILHDKKHWDNPEQFHPDRFNSGKYKLNQYPFIPFSNGIRVCPTANGFTEAAFKIALTFIFRDNDLLLTKAQSLENMPVHTKQPRLKQKYFARLVPTTCMQSAATYLPAHKSTKETSETMSGLCQQLAETTLESSPRAASNSSFSQRAILRS